MAKPETGGDVSKPDLPFDHAWHMKTKSLQDAVAFEAIEFWKLYKDDLYQIDCAEQFVEAVEALEKWVLSG